MSYHPRALAARIRNEEKKRVESEIALKKAYDEMWKDDDKINNRKEARKVILLHV